MKCSKCKNKAISLNPAFCEKHFISYVESTVKKTVKDYRLIKKGDKVAVACSGGKDSTTALYILNKFYPSVEAIAIDEGISGYREHTLRSIKEFCKNNEIKLNIFSFNDEFGMPLDKIMTKTEGNPCTVCGVLRRYLLNKCSGNYSSIVTGHNMDDEAQSILMNFFRNNLPLSARLGPVAGLVKDSRFTPRIKPLYFCSEKETATYSFLKGFNTRIMECPNVGTSFRLDVKMLLNDYEYLHPGTKRAIVKSFIRYQSRIKEYYKTSEKPNSCINCGGPAYGEVCNACSILNKIKSFK